MTRPAWAARDTRALATIAGTGALAALALTATVIGAMYL